MRGGGRWRKVGAGGCSIGGQAYRKMEECGYNTSSYPVPVTTSSSHVGLRQTGHYRDYRPLRDKVVLQDGLGLAG